MNEAPAIEWQRIQHARNGDTYAARFGAGWLVRFRECIPSDNDALTSSMVYVPDAEAFPVELEAIYSTLDNTDEELPR